MQMPENYKVEDGKLTIFVDELEFEFLEKSDFIYSDKGKILLKHHAITVLAQGAGIAVGMPVLLSSHDRDSFVIAREAVKQNGVRYSAIGDSTQPKRRITVHTTGPCSALQAYTGKSTAPANSPIRTQNMEKRKRRKRSWL